MNKTLKALALFEKYTDMPRWMEIGYSIDPKYNNLLQSVK